MKSPPGIPLYNQDRLSDSDFVDNFVARGELVEALLNDLRAQAERGESRHTLIVGARGMGKSSLLRRIAIGVSADPRLRENFVPLRFREEQYNVITLDAFWRNCGEALAEWCENDGRGELATRLDYAIASPPWRDAEQAAAAFMAACGELGRRAILLIDNLDIVLDALAERECWALRNVLQRKGGPVVFGAATSLLRQGGDRGAPFYEFFFPHVLEPLNEAELLRCMRALAEKRGEPGKAVTTILAREPQRVRALFALTGGNPRVLALIYQLLERAESEEILADLETLLDGVTPYYKARVEEYGASQQRAVIDAIALNWDPMTSNAIGQVTGVEVTTISSQLSKLKKDGFVEEVATSGARAGYQISERFLNIWYLMRHGTRRVRQRLRWLTLFLTKLFSPEELGRMLAEAGGEEGAGRWRADWRIAVREAYDLACAPLETRDSYQGDLMIPLDVVSQSSSGAEVPTTKVSFEIDLEGLRTSFDTIADLFESRKYREALAICEDILIRFGDSRKPALQSVVARALFNKGATLGELGRSQDAIDVYDDLVARLSEATETPLREAVARALFNKGATLGELGRSQDAIEVYDDLVARLSETTETPLREAVARALFNKGFTLGALGRSQDAIDVYDDLVARFGEATETPLRERVARALVNKGGILLDQRGDTTGAEAFYRQALTFDGKSILAKANLAWGVLTTGNVAEAEALRADLGAADLALLDAGIEFAKDNFGLAVDHLGRALKDGLEDGKSPFFEDLLRLLRLAEAKGYGERLIAWFESTGYADRYAPVFAALVAFVRGERFLLDVNPEVRAPARKLFDRLAAPRKYTAPKTVEPARRGRGRPRKVGGGHR